MSPEEKRLFLAALALHDSHVFGCGTTKMRAYEEFDEAAAAFWRKQHADGATSVQEVVKKYK